jgi:hypothetical protein
VFPITTTDVYIGWQANVEIGQTGRSVSMTSCTSMGGKEERSRSARK